MSGLLERLAAKAEAARDPGYYPDRTATDVARWWIEAIAEEMEAARAMWDGSLRDSDCADLDVAARWLRTEAREDS